MAENRDKFFLKRDSHCGDDDTDSQCGCYGRDSRCGLGRITSKGSRGRGANGGFGEGTVSVGFGEKQPAGNFTSGNFGESCTGKNMRRHTVSCI